MGLIDNLTEETAHELTGLWKMNYSKESSSNLIIDKQTENFDKTLQTYYHKQAISYHLTELVSYVSYNRSYPMNRIRFILFRKKAVKEMKAIIDKIDKLTEVLK